MAKEKRVWFEPLGLVTLIETWRSIVDKKPVEPGDQFLVPCTWQGWLITATTGALGYGVARLAMYLYSIKAEYGFAGWVGFAMIIIIFMYIATMFSNRP